MPNTPPAASAVSQQSAIVTGPKGEEIYCTVPKGLDLTGCALKLFVLSEAYAPDRKVEFILLSE